MSDESFDVVDETGLSVVTLVSIIIVIRDCCQLEHLKEGSQT
jgi:hypothetical protein